MLDKSGILIAEVMELFVSDVQEADYIVPTIVGKSKGILNANGSLWGFFKKSNQSFQLKFPV